MRTILAIVSFTFMACTAQSDTTVEESDITCTTDHDCATAAGGGRCTPTTHVCRADNECGATADCIAPRVCVRASAFGNHGLCTLPNTPPEPTPIAVCDPATTNVCPPATECGPDFQCHRKYCITDAQCPTGETCHPQCPEPTATSVAFGVCEPAGLPIQVCPPPPGPTATP